MSTTGRPQVGGSGQVGGRAGRRHGLLPPENATGNYVKVVQRIPVKLLFEQGEDTEHRLRPGMSVVAKVKVKRSEGLESRQILRPSPCPLPEGEGGPSCGEISWNIRPQQDRK